MIDKCICSVSVCSLEADIVNIIENEKEIGCFNNERKNICCRN